MTKLTTIKSIHIYKEMHIYIYVYIRKKTNEIQMNERKQIC